MNASPTVTLLGDNVLTGLPRGASVVRLEQAQCLDLTPIGSTAHAFRPYHLDDTLRAKPSAGGKICGRDAGTWLRAHHIEVTHTDVFELPIYPLIPAKAATQALLEWFFADKPDPAMSAMIAAYPRLSAAQIPQEVNFGRFFAQRHANHADALQAEFIAFLERADARVFEQDFAAIADFSKTGAPLLRRWLLKNQALFFDKITRPEHRSRFLMLLSKISTGTTRERLATASDHGLSASILAASGQPAKSHPRRTLKEDQIVWARSPVRLDLAGGWTDTPPYCLENGGAVLNVAVLLNGQPPIQTFIRPIAEPLFRLRSIDLGLGEEIRTHADLNTFRDPRSGFSLPKAALALAGFHPDFVGGKPPKSLRAQLRTFGGGLEISLLSAVPKGSGLGTSSILGATLLGALNRACGLGWDEVDLYNRVLGVEQLLTTGGGWQDQAGALFPGVKLVQTDPGAAQVPSIRYLPTHLLGSGFANQTLLLYYTGITRLAKGILREIVQDMFLRRTQTLQTLGHIRTNAIQLYDAMKEGNPHALHRCVARSWTLNKRLDSGTATPEIEKIIALCGPDLVAGKLLGAGGGGYMFLCAKDAEAGRRLRANLEKSPPNPRARFIDFCVADQGLEVTTS